MAEESKHEDDVGAWEESKHEEENLDAWLGEDESAWFNNSSSSADTTTLREMEQAERAAEANERLNSDLIEVYLNPLIEEILRIFEIEQTSRTQVWGSAITREWAHAFLDLDQEEQLLFIKEAIRDPKVPYTKKVFQNWLDQYHPDHDSNADLANFGWQPYRRMPEYIGESIDEGSYSKKPPTSTREDLLPLFPSTLSQDLIRDPSGRQEPDERVEEEYGGQGLSVEALSIHDYDLPEGQEVGISQTISNNMFTIPEENPIHKSEVIVHARKLPIYNIPVEDRVEMEMQEQLQANDTGFFTRHNDNSVDVQVANSYEDTLRYADWEVVSEQGMGENERPILYANYEGARNRERNERRHQRQLEEGVDRLQLEAAMRFVRRNEPDNWRRF